MSGVPRCGIASGHFPFLRIRALTDTPEAFVETAAEAQARAAGAWHDAVGRLSSVAIERCDTLALEVGVENPRAHAAYRRLGFVATGECRPHPLYPELTEITMAGLVS
jgi:ribosomal protein S18 acetylase RimI-like enzyme